MIKVGVHVFSFRFIFPTINLIRLTLRENCTPNQKLACFVLYLKLSTSVLQISASYSKLSKELKNGLKF